MSKFIPLSIPNFEGNEKKYVNDALDSTFVSTVGSYVNKFEKALAQYLLVPNVAVCQSGTSALHLALIEAGIGQGDVVLVPPLTFIAAVNPVKYQSAIPVFIDCDDSFCIDPIKLRSFCEEECHWDGNQLSYQGKAVKAMIVVHVFGNMADMNAIMEIAHTYNLKVIEDATEALGTQYTEGEYKGKFAGTIGDFGCYSFNGNKIITTGGGGAITSNDPQKVDHIRFLSTQAKTDPVFYVHDEVGYNYRMTNLQAALGVAQLEELPEFVLRKQHNYDMYKQYLQDCEYASLKEFRPGTSSNKWFYSIEINRNVIKAPMKEIIQRIREKGIETRAIWGLINEQRPYRNEITYKITKASYYAERILNIPSSTQITEEDIFYVSEEIKGLFEEMRND
ncbi:LegC family aminotransferase [Butyrivibrio sp. MC2013]|uniref:LegC family aminotransferase n=1 Tax=Butyrivibrio sp. MC2013 TaxID=1280686 RepID=UPI00041E3CB5|nr:LegC family aminotransferase [Butyrivibrio sp. MC2013]